MTPSTILITKTLPEFLHCHDVLISKDLAQAPQGTFYPEPLIPIMIPGCTAEFHGADLRLARFSAGSRIVRMSRSTVAAQRQSQSKEGLGINRSSPRPRQRSLTGSE
jgi:hypothetical protein